ncbi:hypothetical protein BJ875DRAFT_510793 [Amylocarpus encephaloides]|uniref:Alkyl hydroperoxide reductase subunit C/ Thiol specific antioxidant domain-containing protein n=1 Tax=Amylocarpus encephaloides TaxID=45428 RepID=A0A9P7YI28_9HELO|nr:hypothetical protein BJ875DRAFT_510793 [Amylocarpus encephaloides]
MQSQQSLLSSAIADAPVSNPNFLPSLIRHQLLICFVVAEKTFQQLRKLAGKYPNFQYLVVPHSDQEATEKWLISNEREAYVQWGLALYSGYQLRKQENIWNKPTESGNRWQTAGNFAVDERGVVKWTRVAEAADDVPDLKGSKTLLKLLVRASDSAEGHENTQT